ncbi:hypothetical protein CFK39_08125 [Brachybacterium avium]|uniref:Uncharacterized protein n=1 Tax=Brachybacterium avium TaxID=2017485 RepID=A0A220UCJ9_9MICO|nr:hypothetical protein [Brachybacterium avium]ASK65805.1 hypothetical protein CFK39_08125 [Brachybacterium avium]
MEGPDALADLPEDLTAGAETAKVEGVHCEADLALKAPVTTCTVGDSGPEYTAHLVRSGIGGSDLAVLLTAAALSEDLLTEVTDPEVSVQYAAGGGLFAEDPAGLDPESLRLRAEMALSDMGLATGVQDCTTENGTIVTCTAAAEGTEAPVQITLYPAISMSGSPLTVGLLRHA